MANDDSPRQDRIYWYNGNDDQSQHLINGTDYVSLSSSAIDSCNPLRDDPMLGYTAGVGNGQFLPDSYAARVAGDGALVAVGKRTYGAIRSTQIDMAAASSSLPYAQDNEYGDGQE